MYSEVYAILNILGEKYINKIPPKLFELIKNERDLEYNPNLLMDNGMFNEKLISRETLSLFSVLNVTYFMNNEEEQKEYFEELHRNEEKRRKILYENYNSDNIFKKNDNKKEEKVLNNQIIEIKKTSIIRKIINKIKNF